VTYDPPVSSVEVAGPEEGAAVVFLHGPSSNLAIWDAQVSELADEFRCIAVDLPGHGEMRGTRFTLDEAVQFTKWVIDDFTSGVAVLVGHSLGGYVAIATAAAHPDAVLGIVASGTGVEFRGRLGRENRRHARWMTLAGPLLHRPAHKALAKVAPEGVARAVRKRGHSFLGAAQGLRQLIDQGFGEMVRGYGGPVLLLNGERDEPNVAAARELVEGVAKAEVGIVAGAGHSPNLTQPAVFNGAVRRFVHQSLGG
jgi:pimeloyl-ACP methyl ester carboxylesterase